MNLGLLESYFLSYKRNLNKVNIENGNLTDLRFVLKSVAACSGTSGTSLVPFYFKSSDFFYIV